MSTPQYSVSSIGRYPNHLDNLSRRRLKVCTEMLHCFGILRNYNEMYQRLHFSSMLHEAMQMSTSESAPTRTFYLITKGTFNSAIDVSKILKK